MHARTVSSVGAAAVPGARLLLLHRAELVVAVARCGRSRSGAVKAQPETLTANAESARWRSNLYCAVRSATRVVPHHAFHERDRCPGNFLNEIIWSYRTGGVGKHWFSRKHDVLLFYA